MRDLRPDDQDNIVRKRRPSHALLSSRHVRDLNWRKLHRHAALPGTEPTPARSAAFQPKMWQQHLFAGVDYDGDMVNEKQLSADIKLYSDQINKIKETMGLNKKAREEAMSDGNFSAWLTDLKARAKLFGIHREQQLTKALVLMKELVTSITRPG